MAVLPQTEAGRMTPVRPISPIKILFFLNDVVYTPVALPLLLFISFVFTPVPITRCIGHPIALFVYKKSKQLLPLPSYSLLLYCLRFTSQLIQVACLPHNLPFSLDFCLLAGQAWRSSSHTSIRFLASLPTQVPTKSAQLTLKFQFQTFHPRPKPERPLLKSPLP